MANLKNQTLRKRTEGMLETAENFNDLFKIGAELHDIGRLIQRMACHMKDLQDKVDGQAEELRRIQWDEVKKDG